MAAVRITVPASSANLGPGFDAVGMALGLHLVVSTGEGPSAPERHPAVQAFRHLGGRGPLDVVTSVPPARGLGFSGAARVGGLLAAACQQGLDVDVLGEATALEGHADNAAASLLGGVVVVADGRAARLPVPVQGRIVLWIPPTETHTSRSRAVLDDPVRREDAVFNVGRTALLVAAITTGSVELLRTATQDRLHQDVRLRTATDSRAAIDAALDAGAWAAWLSGSGPSVAAWCAAGEAATVAANLPPAGRHRVVDIDTQGAHVEA
jgi:homoserine kinase